MMIASFNLSHVLLPFSFFPEYHFFVKLTDTEIVGGKKSYIMNFKFNKNFYYTKQINMQLNTINYE